MGRASAFYLLFSALPSQPAQYAPYVLCGPAVLAELVLFSRCRRHESETLTRSAGVLPVGQPTSLPSHIAVLPFYLFVVPFFSPSLTLSTPSLLHLPFPPPFFNTALHTHTNTRLFTHTSLISRTFNSHLSKPKLHWTSHTNQHSWSDIPILIHPASYCIHLSAIFHSSFFCLEGYPS